MQTQKDHVEAYAFQAGRMAAAMVTGEAGYLEAPARRAKLGLLVGVVSAVLIVTGFFLYGLIRHQLDVARAREAVRNPVPAVSTGSSVRSSPSLRPSPQSCGSGADSTTDREGGSTCSER